MHRHLRKTTGIRKNQRSTTPPKEYSEPPVTGPKEVQIQEVPNKEFRIIILF